MLYRFIQVPSCTQRASSLAKVIVQGLIEEPPFWDQFTFETGLSLAQGGLPLSETVFGGHAYPWSIFCHRGPLLFFFRMREG